MGTFQIAVIPGDGIGPEVTTQTVAVLQSIEKLFSHTFQFTEGLAGGAAIDKTGECLPEETVTLCKNSQGVLLGAVGGPKWDGMQGDKRPEKALLGLREKLQLFANLRPATIHGPLADACPIKAEYLGEKLDILIVRELTGGIYFGERGIREGKYGTEAFDVECYSEKEVERIARIAFEAARKREKRLCSVDKANVLESSRLWRRVVTEVAKEYPDVALSHMYVDNAAMQLIRNPKQFDVIVTNNIFGDILSDEASMITGSIGLLPSASLGEGALGMYEPIHGSAPDIAGKDQANPIAAILSGAMLLRYSFGLEKEAEAVEKAVEKVLEEGYRTPDIMGNGGIPVGTKEMGEKIVAALSESQGRFNQ